MPTRVATLVVALALLTVASMGCSSVIEAERVNSPLIEAERLVLVDAQGNARGGLAVTDQGDAALFLADGEGNPRLSVRVAEKGRPEVTLFDRDDRPRVVLTILDDGSALVSLANPEKQARLMLSQNPKTGATSIDLVGDGKQPYVSLGGGQIVIQEEKGKVLFKAP